MLYNLISPKIRFNQAKSDSVDFSALPIHSSLQSTYNCRIQEEREERHKYKGVVKTPIESELDLFMKSGDVGSFDNGDPTTTNLYLGNLNPKVNTPETIFS